MAQSETFRQLLTEAIYRISAWEGDKPIQVVQDEVGYALNKRGGSSAVEYWRQGHLPKLADVEKLAHLIRARSDLDQAWLARFLQSAAYPRVPELCSELFPASPPPAPTADTPPLSPASPPLFLPNQSYRTLVGRETLVSEALAALQDPQGRWIIAIDGQGGMGKTALAREVVAQALKRQLFADILWISAAHSAGSGAGATTALRRAPVNSLTLDGLFNAIVLQAGLPGLAQLPEAEKALRVQALLRRQRFLLVLDNLETAADPQALLLDRLYTMLNPSKLLCTSRLRFTGQVYAIHLGSLSEPAAIRFLREEAQERRRFPLITAPEEALSQISTATGGSPLALKLVVGQLAYLPLSTVLAHLRQAQTLATRLSGAEEGHFYQAIYHPSWQLLSASGQQLLIAMSLLTPGSGGTAAVIAAISGLPETDLLMRLQEGWQLSWLETAPVEADAPTLALPSLRYYLHPLAAHFLIWEVCRFGEQLSPPAQAQASTPESFGTFTDCLTNALHYGLAQLVHYGAVAPPVAERQWLMHLLDYALKVPALWSLTSQVLIKAAPTMEQAGHRRDWLPYVQQGLEASHQQGDGATAAEMQLQAGMLHQLLGEYDQADRYLTSSAVTFEVLGDQQNQARAFNRLAYVARLQRRYADAVQVAQQALSLLAPTDAECGSSHTVLGAVALDFQRWDEALHHFQQALAHWQPSGNQRMIARRLRDLGPALRAQQRYAEARACYEQAIELFGEIADPLQQAVTRTNLGVVYTELGQPEQAIQLYRQAEPIFRQTYDERQLAMLLNNLALAYQAQQQMALAETTYHQSIACWQSVGDMVALVTVMDGLGLLYLEQQNYAKALPLFQQAYTLLAGQQTETTAQLCRDVQHHLDAARLGQQGKPAHPEEATPVHEP
ncbi:MAG: tetratricopeptide repeat protein [Caldilineaceae bacterium]|nr:tetratricopeptide repeat protein [Caldilineaceae bacterium]